MLTARTRRSHARPNLELLDARVLPSAAVVVAPATTGTSAFVKLEQRIEARHAALEAKIQAREAAQAARLAAREAKAIRMTVPPPSATVSTAVITPLAAPSAAPAPSLAVSVTAGAQAPAASTTAAISAATTAAPLTSAVAGSSTPAFTSTSSDASNVQDGPLAKAGQDLVALNQQYQTFLAGGGSASNFNTTVNRIEVSGGNVGVDLSASGDLAAYESAVQALGMTIQHVDATTGLVEGMLPISQLEAVAQMTNTAGITPIYQPFLDTTGILR